MFIVWSWCLVYSICSFIFGQNGYYAVSHHQEEIINLSDNVKNLERIQQELISIREELSNNPMTRSRYLQSLGYVPEGKKIIRIVGININNYANRSIGQVVYAQKPSGFFHENAIKLIAFIFAVFIFISLIGFDIYSNKENSRENPSQ